MNTTILGKRNRNSTNSAEVSIPRKNHLKYPEIYVEDDESLFEVRKTRRITRGPIFPGSGKLPKQSKTRPLPTGQGLRSKPEVIVYNKTTDIKESEKCLSDDEYLPPIQNPTPKTPRHRDALSKRVPVTPNRLLGVETSLTSRTPRSPTTPGRSIITIYSQARQIFTKSSELGRLIGRESERKELFGLVQNCISKRVSGCIYVSGPPGTGKSALVNEVTNLFETSETLEKSYINCMSMKTSKDLYSNLLEAFCSETEVFEGQEVDILQELFISRNKSKISYIIILDEIDHILSLDLEILYKLFEWALHKKSSLVLIGIANALDLTDRFLPRLKARDLKPQLIPFSPYNSDEIKTVIINRLKLLMPIDSNSPSYVPFIHPAAIDFCARKVSSQTGDLRKAFDICRQAIDMIESETKQKHQRALNEHMFIKDPFQSSHDNKPDLLLSPSTLTRDRLADSLATLTVETAPRASLSHVNRVTSSTFGNGATQRLKALNLQQKAAICALVAFEKRKRKSAADLMATPSKLKDAAPTIKALYDIYCRLCLRDHILHPLTSTEFRDVIGSLETLSLVSEADNRMKPFFSIGTPKGRASKSGNGIISGDSKRITSCVGEKEVAQAVEGLGSGILKSILSGEGLD
ncbi:hypothetical protein K3495_g2801 [Podosphaera aphanis]|nr:hypothetical protein K3495_g2801 [Podosphaera aphanis]